MRLNKIPELGTSVIFLTACYSISSYLGGILYYEIWVHLLHLSSKLDENLWPKLDNWISHPKNLSLEQMINKKGQFRDYLCSAAVAEAAASDEARRGIQTRWFPWRDIVCSFFYLPWLLSIFWFFSLSTIAQFYRLSGIFWTSSFST